MRSWVWDVVVVDVVVVVVVVVVVAVDVAVDDVVVVLEKSSCTVRVTVTMLRSASSC